MKRAIGYIRVSTDQQAQEGVSLDAQREKIAAWCAYNGYELAEVFTDAGISGKTIKNRPELNKALAAMGKDMALVVYSLSRLARSTKDCIHIAERIDAAGADLVSLTEQIDTASPMGEFFFTLIAALAQLERKMISERTLTAMAYKKANNEPCGHIPFGYTEVEGRLKKVEKEAELVASIIAQRQAGSTLTEIADRLNSAGIAGKQGGKWYASTVRHILQRKAA